MDAKKEERDEFKRENRYFVFKISDLIKLTPTAQEYLAAIGREVAAIREEAGKQPLECVVIESDWPEYEPAWRMIQDRVTGSAALRTHENVGQESGSVQDAVDKFRALLADCTESERQQARAIFCEVLGVGGQESEAGAAARLHIRKEDDGIYASVQVLNGERLQIKDSPVDVYLAPPSAQAIETAAIMKCVEVCQKTQSDMDDQADSITDFTYKDAFEEVEARLIALIPQDGRTALSQCQKEALLEAVEVCKTIANDAEDCGATPEMLEIIYAVEDELRRRAEGEK